MIVTAAFCPNPPVLIPEVAQAAAPELADLRAACRAVIALIAAPGVPLVVLGAGASARAHAPNARGSFAGYGVPLEVSLGSDVPGPLELPLSLSVGAWLVHDCLGPNSGTSGFSIVDEPPVLDDADVALLVMGDGSARRSTAAPGYLDERAGSFDAEVEAALRSGEPARLAALDPQLGAQLLAGGVPAWRAAGRLLAEPNDATEVHHAAEVHYAEAPYGVGYFVAQWTAQWTART